MPEPRIQAASPEPAPTAPPPPAESPGDEAASGTPGTGENVCPSCGGSGRQGNVTCPECQGSGKVTTGIGGG